MHSILVINPGSTSTKIALAEDDHIVNSETILHSAEDISSFKGIWEQYEFRLNICERWVSKHVRRCDAVVGMGGLLRPLQGGTYAINEAMLRDARANLQGEHASNLGCALAQEIALRFHCPAFVVDPVSVDEFEPVAFFSGHAHIQRRSLSHALNIHAAARRAARELSIPYAESSFIIAHLGGGISIAPVKSGNIIDVNDAASDGPFSPERTGGLPLQQFITMCFSGKYSEKEMRAFVMGKGGLVSYLGTTSSKEIEERILAGDARAREVYEAMSYQIAKEIGAMATTLCGRVHAIILTGGLAHSTMLCNWITERVKFIAPLLIYPGEDEMLSLALGALRVLTNEEPSHTY